MPPGTAILVRTPHGLRPGQVLSPASLDLPPPPRNWLYAECEGTVYLSDGNIFDGIGPIDSFLMAERQERESVKPKFKMPKKRLLKEMRLDLTDLMLHLIKKQPRIMQTGHWRHDYNIEGGRHYNRDEAMHLGRYRLVFRDETLAYLEVKPHRRLRMVNVKNGWPRLGQAMILNVADQYFPGMKIVKPERGQRRPQARRSDMYFQYSEAILAPTSEQISRITRSTPF